MPDRRPNILLVMFDQLTPGALPSYGHPLVKTPNLSAIAERGAVFENAYCNSPLCAPSRFSMLAGQHCSRIGAYDNAADFPADVPTIAHYLRGVGYRTCLSGKMHFVGPDQRHGYEERVTTDIYPADYGWTPDWDTPEIRPFWYHDMLSVVEAGVYERTLALDFDDETAYQAGRKIFDYARDGDDRPFFLTVSFMQPHDPYMTPRAYWDRYSHDAIDLPSVGPISPDSQDPHSRRLCHVIATDQYRFDDRHVRNARHGYYGMIGYLDDQVGRLRDALEQAGLADDTLWVITSDHGDMLGERGLWYKMCFFEGSARVPFVMAGPGVDSGLRVTQNVSLVDLLPTLVEYAADGATGAPASPLDGRNLLPLLDGDAGDASDTVVAEYLAEGAVSPMLMVRSGQYKYISAPGDPPQLFDLQTDPHELANLSGARSLAEVEAGMRDHAAAHWNADDVREAVLASQRRRRLVHEAMMQGTPTAWDYQPFFDATKQYNRNYGGELYDTDRRARIPFKAPPSPDGD